MNVLLKNYGNDIKMNELFSADVAAYYYLNTNSVVIIKNRYDSMKNQVMPYDQFCDKLKEWGKRYIDYDKRCNIMQDMQKIAEKHNIVIVPKFKNGSQVVVADVYTGE